MLISFSLVIVFVSKRNSTTPEFELRIYFLSDFKVSLETFEAAPRIGNSKEMNLFCYRTFEAKHLLKKLLVNADSCSGKCSMKAGGFCKTWKISSGKPWSSSNSLSSNVDSAIEAGRYSSRSSRKKTLEIVHRGMFMETLKLFQRDRQMAAWAWSIELRVFPMISNGAL